ncbi:MAG: hypothetical protein MK110_06720 [Fuerstiella sp.]|nr:hypothetical protein [Fuerstiella sp.]
MFPSQMFRAALITAVVLSMSAANAQYFGDGCSDCGVGAPPVASCVPIQPVQTTCYQQVPVTTFRREKQTVREPYYRTTYEDREVTAMRPVTTQREIEIPTLSYQNVTEHRTVTRDMGRWITRYTPTQKMSPCQVDARPGVIGWLNRTGYAFRSSFTPKYYTSRQYVPKMMACTVPVTRQVAVRGTRRVSVNETKMVAHKTTERVAVQKLEYRNRVVTVMRPQTAYRTVPIGSRLAYGYGGYAPGSAVAFAPIIEDSRTAQNPEPDPSFQRSASRDNDEKAPFADDGEGVDHDGHYHRSSKSREMVPLDTIENFDGGVSSDPKKMVLPAGDSPLTTAKSGGWSRTSLRTAKRSSSRTGRDDSHVTLTQRSGN